jgi:hypothetical protein
MNQDALFYLMTAAVGVSALAVVIQTLVLYAIYRAARAAGEQIREVSGQVESLTQTTQRTLEQSRKQLTDVTTKAGEVLDLARTQLVRVDDVLAEATTRAKIQMDRVELVLDDTISRLHETAALVHNGVLKPIKEVNGVAVGIRAFIGALLRGRRLTVEQATHDEEMFI